MRKLFDSAKAVKWISCNRTMGQIVRFLFVGGSATILQYLLLVFGVEVMAVAPLMASIVAYILSALYNYFASFYFTFSNRSNHKAAAVRFPIMVVGGLLLNTVVFACIFEVLHFSYLLAQIVASGAVLVFNFLTSKFWTFKEQVENGAEEL